MKHCFMILAHGEPQLLKLFLSQIDGAENTIIVHIDKKSDIKIFKPAFEVVKKAKLVVLKNRVRIKWGSYSILKAEMRLLDEALRHDFDYCHLCSGQDLLIKPLDELSDFLQKTACDYYDEIGVPSDKQLYHDMVFNRVRLYHFIPQNIKKDMARGHGGFREWLLSMQKKLIVNRCKKESVTYAFGWQWFTLSKKAATFVLSRKKHLLKRYKFTHCPDEIAIQTEIYNSEFYKKDNYSLLYVDWSEGKANPKTLDDSDYEKLISSDKFFARKFTLVNKGVVRKILTHTNKESVSI